MKREKYIERLIETITGLTLEQAKNALLKQAHRPMSSARRIEFERDLTSAITGKSPREVVISADRAISRTAIKALADSPMLGYTRHIIEAAMDPRAPFQTRDILMLAAGMAGGKAFFITKDGIPHNYATQAGYILSMAGFERVSHYDRERGSPIKAWKPAHKYKNCSAEVREQMVYDHIREVVGEVDELPEQIRSPKPQSLEDFI